MRRNKQGFTLIEMLVVIAIVSVMVSMIVPVVRNNIIKAEAAADAANLRTILATLNINVINGQKTVDEIIAETAHPRSQMDSDAVLSVVYDAPGFIDVYYVNGEVYYGLDYLSEIAETGESNLSTDEPSIEGTWYTVTGTP